MLRCKCAHSQLFFLYSFGQTELWWHIWFRCFREFIAYRAKLSCIGKENYSFRIWWIKKKQIRLWIKILASILALFKFISLPSWTPPSRSFLGPPSLLAAPLAGRSPPRPCCTLWKTLSWTRQTLSPLICWRRSSQRQLRILSYWWKKKHLKVYKYWFIVLATSQPV